jgi:hypothetical protein
VPREQGWVEAHLDRPALHVEGHALACQARRFTGEAGSSPVNFTEFPRFLTIINTGFRCTGGERSPIGPGGRTIRAI